MRRILDKQLSSSVIALILGSLIYLCFRSDTLLMFQWLDSTLIKSFVSLLRQNTIPFSKYLPHWMLYSLPDGLWLFSYVTILRQVWGYRLSKQNIFWVIFIPGIAIASEIGQMVEIVPGTYDVLDLVCYFLGFFVPIIVCKHITRFKGELNEKY